MGEGPNKKGGGEPEKKINKQGETIIWNWRVGENPSEFFCNL